MYLHFSTRMMLGIRNKCKRSIDCGRLSSTNRGFVGRDAQDMPFLHGMAVVPDVGGNISNMLQSRSFCARCLRKDSAMTSSSNSCSTQIIPVRTCRPACLYAPPYGPHCPTSVLFYATGGFVSSALEFPTGTWLSESIEAILAPSTKLKYIVYTHSHWVRRILSALSPLVKNIGVV